MLLPCPHCGRRPVAEFRYGGEDGLSRPRGDETLGAAAPDGAILADRLYGFDNPKGVSPEWWQHVVGCRAWFRLVRDTGSDRIIEGGP